MIVEPFSINIFIKIIVLLEFHFFFNHKHNLFDITSLKHSCTAQGLDPEKRQIL